MSIFQAPYTHPGPTMCFAAVH